MRKRLTGSSTRTALAVVMALSMGLAGCGSTGGTDAEAIIAGGKSVAVSNRALTTGEAGQCANGGRAIDIWFDKDNDSTMDTNELISTEIICNGTNGANGVDGATGATGPAGANGADGAAGAAGANGVDGKTALIKVTTEVNGANCANGGQKIEVGLDDDANMTLDALEVDQTTYVCNGKDAAGDTLTAKGEACPICHGAGKSEDAVAAHALPQIHNRGAALLGRTELANIAVAPTLAGNTLGALSVTFDLKTYDAENALANNSLITAANATTPTNLNSLSFYVAKFDPPTNAWKRIISGSKVLANLVNNNGTGLADATNYTYTFPVADLTTLNVTDSNVVGPFGFSTSGQYRLYVRASVSNYYGPSSSTKDFTMDGTTALIDRQIVTTAACEGCHGQIPNHGVSRPDAQTCVICHNGPAKMSLVSGKYVYDTAMPFSGSIAQDVWVHELHANFGFKTHFTAGEMTYPQDLRNCKTCHKGTAGATAYNTYKLTACKACHQDSTIFTTGTPIDHRNYTDADSAICAVCHNDGVAKSIATGHATALASPNAIAQVAGFSKIEYDVTSASVDSATGDLTIVFSISKDGTKLNLTDLATEVPNFTGGPSFLLAYAMAQDGVAAPADYNNLGKTAAQPASVSLANIIKNSITTPLTGWSLTNNAGVATAVIPAASAFPAGATLRAVGLQGYFTDSRGTTDTADNIALHTKSVAKAVTGDAVRRKVVDPNKCAACHEWFEGHGGNRVFETQVCAMCHVPNLTSSGRSVPVGTTVNASGGAVPGGTATLADIAAFPETAQSLKALIHGTHSSELREDPFEFVRYRSSTAFTFDMSEVEFPGILKNCETCHITGTYGMGQANLLNTTVVTTPGGIPSNTDVAAARTTVPNATDLVATPVYSTCAFCHDGAMQDTHYKGNGGGVAPRSQINQ